MAPATVEAGQSAAVFDAPDTDVDWIECDDIGKLAPFPAVYDSAEMNDCSDCDDPRAARPSITLEAIVCPPVFGTLDELNDRVDCNDVKETVLFAA